MALVEPRLLVMASHVVWVLQVEPLLVAALEQQAARSRRSMAPMAPMDSALDLLAVAHSHLAEVVAVAHCSLTAPVVLLLRMDLPVVTLVH